MPGCERSSHDARWRSPGRAFPRFPFRRLGGDACLDCIRHDRGDDRHALWRRALADRAHFALDPFRIANQYGLFAVMTRGRYEIEFQGSNDGDNWTAYPFRYKPQALNEAPRIYAPYQPRFEWNLWFASLGDWRQNHFVPLTEERLLANDADVLGAVSRQPVSQRAAPIYSRGAVAVLVYIDGREAAYRQLVATPVAWGIRAGDDPDRRRQAAGRPMARRIAAA